MYAIVKVGGKQYRVEKGDSLLVDRMHEEEGAKVRLEPLMFRPDGDGEDSVVFAGEELAKVKVEATVTGHERGKKVHVLKFKPKRGYKRRQGHRADLTRLEIGAIELARGGKAAKKDSKDSRETDSKDSASVPNETDSKDSASVPNPSRGDDGS